MNKQDLMNRTKAFSIKVFQLADTFPRSKASDVLTHQILRSASSVAANYRAACRAKSKADFIYKLKIVEEESDESLFWLEMIRDLNLIPLETNLKHLLQEANELTAIFTSSVKTLKSTNPKS